MNKKPPRLLATLASVTSIAFSCSGSTSGSPATPGSDPLYTSQWHLKNSGTNTGSVKGEDINVESLFTAGSKGSGVTVAVVDDGMDILHEDLKDNVLAGKSYNYLDGGTDPSGSSATHGTACSGIIAARDLNNKGGRGVAPRASLVSYNLLQNPTSANVADAMTRNIANIFVSSNSWGATDCRGTYADSSSTWKSAIQTGLSTGRNGKGTVYVWAAGNGAGDTGGACSGYGEIDNANYDGQANYYGVIAIGAIGDNGKRAAYSEKGANLWVNTYSEGSTGNAIITTDITGTSGYNMNSSKSGYTNNNNYTNSFNGTSAAAPLAAGAVALILEANPKLGWRDVKVILAKSARKNDSSDSDWTTNGASPAYNISHKYGFGTIDAAAAVTLAKTWSNLGSMVTYSTPTSTVGSAIPDNDTTGVSASIEVSGSGITSLEYVSIALSAEHTSTGDLQITLTSPAGTSSTLAEPHTCLNGSGSTITCSSYTSVRFGSARSLGEKANGTWTLKIKDLVSGNTGTFTNWSLTLYGT